MAKLAEMVARNSSSDIITLRPGLGGSVRKERTEMVSFVVPGRPVPAARMTQRGKWTSRARRSLAYQEAVAWAAKAAGVPVLSGPVCLTARIYVYGRRRGDLSNYLKALEDGLQYAGIIPNDKQIIRYGGQTGIYPAANREDERVEIVLEKVQYPGVGADAAAT